MYPEENDLYFYFDDNLTLLHETLKFLLVSILLLIDLEPTKYCMPPLELLLFFKMPHNFAFCFTHQLSWVNS